MNERVFALRKTLPILHVLSGAVVPFTGIIGEPIVLALIAFALLSEISKDTLRSIVPFLPILLLCFVWGVCSLLFFQQIATFVTCFVFLLGVFFLLISCSNEKFRKRFSDGLYASLLPAALFTLLEVSLPINSGFFSEAPYWSSQGRVSGTLQDPNAMGLFAFLAIVFCISRIKESRLAGVISVLWFIASLFSGSRSALIGIFLFVYIATYSKRTLFVSLSLCAIFIFVSVNALPTLVDTEVLPVSAVRLLQLLEVGQLAESTLNRTVFYRAGLSLWLHHPLYGVGPGAFADHLVAVSDQLGLGTGLWRDNANNFYIGLLCELGLIGLAASIFAIGHARIRVAVLNPILIAGVLSFCCILFTGPHISFVEILFIFLLLVSSVFEFKNRAYTLLLSLLFVPSLLAIPFVQRATGGGWYNWEKDGSEYYRWSGLYATSYQRCENGKASLRVRSLNPSTDVTVHVSTRAKPDTFTLKPGTSLVRTYQCDNEKALFFELQLSDVWSPAEVSKSPDMRLLGVQVFWRKPSDSLNLDSWSDAGYDYFP